MSFMASFMVGAFSAGVVADSLGRKKGLLLSLVLHIVPNIAVTFTSDLLSFMCLRFLSGASVGGLLAVTFTMIMELVGPSYRMIAGIALELFWACGAIVLALLAYLIRDWRYLNLAVSLPALLFIPYVCIIPESSRWLLTKGREQEAEDILRHAAKVNDKTLPEKLFDYEDSFENDRCVPIWKLCVTPTLLVRSVIIFFNWMVVSMLFFGLSLNVGSLGGDIYINFFLSSLAEVVGYSAPLVALRCLGRKPVYVTSLLLGGAACILTIFPVLYGNAKRGCRRRLGRGYAAGSVWLVCVCRWVISPVTSGNKRTPSTGIYKRLDQIYKSNHIRDRKWRQRIVTSANSAERGRFI
ncbi:organic cation transporter protein-like isoform X2 [Crassostrea virginica]